MNERIEIPAYTDRWMMGDRFGDLVQVTRGKRALKGVEIAHIRLDKSGKLVCAILADCRLI